MALPPARRIATVSLIATLTCGTAARADVTAAEVWKSWQDYYASLGYSIDAGSETPSADGLTLADVTLTMTVPEGTTTATLDRVVMTERGGAVDVALPASVPVLTRGTSDEGKAVETRMTLSQSGLGVTVSGTPADIAYDLSGQSLGLTLDGITVDGKAAAMEMTVTAHDPVGHATLSGTDTRAIAWTTGAGAADLDLSVTDPEGGAGRLDIDGRVEALAGEGRMSQPAAAADLRDMAAALSAGMTVDSSFTYGASRFGFDFVNGADSAKGTLSGETGTGRMQLAAEGIDYRVETSGARLGFQGAQLPFPVELSLARLSSGLSLPLAASDAPAPFAFDARLEEFTVNDAVWALIDPAATLPRDPATLIVDLKGMARVLTSLLSPDADPAAAAPELEQLDLDELRLAIAGADLAGTGSFRFDNSDMTTFDGFPRPEGRLDLKLIGGNTLLDRLVNLGLVPGEQAMGIRMMAGIFANAGPGEDELTSKIEVREDGGVYANGQRIR